MKCSFCGQQLSDLDKYCPNCGSKVDIPPEKQSDKDPNIISEIPPIVIKSTKNKKMLPVIIVAGIAAVLLILGFLGGPVQKKASIPEETPEEVLLERPQEAEDLPRYALDLVKYGKFNDYDEGYPNISNAFNKKFEKSSWEITKVWNQGHAFLAWISYKAIGKNINNENIKAQYEVIFKVTIFLSEGDTRQDNFEAYTYLNGEQISTGDFLAFVYLN